MDVGLLLEQIVQKTSQSRGTMSNKMVSYDDSVRLGLAHVIPHSIDSEGSQLDVSFISEGKGSRKACLEHLEMLTIAKSLVAWFRDHDLQAFKQWAFIAEKLQRMARQLAPTESIAAPDLMYALFSDHEDIISWFSQHTGYFQNNKDAHNPKQAVYFHYQAFLALRGDWDELKSRCERILAMEHEIKKDRRFLLDQRFYLALAEGNIADMESVLTEMTNPKNARIRNFEFPFGLEKRLFSGFATLYAKLAWRHGYQLQVDSVWIPQPWLPVQPLERYEEPWEFMREFDLFTPFEGEFAQLSPVKR